jgi:hypothetical protein
MITFDEAWILETAMSSTWWLLTVLLLAFWFALRFGMEIIERRTCRSTQFERSNRADALFVLIMLAFFVLPLWLFPDLHPVAFILFFCIGALLANLTTQALFGLKKDSNEEQSKP